MPRVPGQKGLEARGPRGLGGRGVSHEKVAQSRRARSAALPPPGSGSLRGSGRPPPPRPQQASRRPALTACSHSTSRALVASSRMSTRGSRTRARAMARRCFCPTASWLPFSPTSAETEKTPSPQRRPGQRPLHRRGWRFHRHRAGGRVRVDGGGGGTSGAAASLGTGPRGVGRPPRAARGRRGRRRGRGTCIEPERQLADELLRPGRPGRSQHLLVAAALQAVGDVVPHRAREQHGLLPYQDHLSGGDGSRLCGNPRGGDPPLLPARPAHHGASGARPTPLPCPALCHPSPSSPPDGAGSGAHTRRPASRPAAPGPRWAGTDSAAARPPCSSQTH